MHPESTGTTRSGGSGWSRSNDPWYPNAFSSGAMHPLFPLLPRTVLDVSVWRRRGHGVTLIIAAMIFYVYAYPHVFLHISIPAGRSFLAIITSVLYALYVLDLTGSTALNMVSTPPLLEMNGAHLSSTRSWTRAPTSWSCSVC